MLSKLEPALLRSPPSALGERNQSVILTGNALGRRGAAKFVVVSNASILFPSADQVSQQRNVGEKNEPQDLAVKGMGLSEGSA